MPEFRFRSISLKQMDIILPNYIMYICFDIYKI